MCSATTTSYRVIVHRVPADEGGGYWAEVPDLPGCATQGETLDELVDLVQDAMRGWLSISDEDIGTAAPIPDVVPSGDFEMQIAV